VSREQFSLKKCDYDKAEKLEVRKPSHLNLRRATNLTKSRRAGIPPASIA
jgi:hypothetical protein